MQPANLVAVGHLIPGDLVLGAQAGGLGGGKAHHAAQRHLADGCRRGAGVLADIHLIRRGHDIIAVAGPRRGGAGRGGGHLAGALEFLQLPLGQLEHAVAAQIALQAVCGLHGIPVVAVPDHCADLGQHRALLLDLAHDVAVGIGRGAEPYAGHLRGHITDAGNRAPGGQRGRDGLALRVADLSHCGQDEAECAPFGPEHFIPGFQRCAALGRHVKVRQHGILCQLGDGIATGGSAQIHAALEQLDIALSAAGNQGIGRGSHDHGGRLSRRGDDIALRVAEAVAVVADITGDVVFIHLHPDEAVDHGRGAVVVGQHPANGQLGFIRDGEDFAVGGLADIDLVLDQLHIALHARGQDGGGGRSGHNHPVGQLIIGQFVRIEHPQGCGGQIAHGAAVPDKVPIVGREAGGPGQDGDHGVLPQHADRGAAGRLAHVHAVHQHQAVVGIALGSGGGRRGGQAGGHIPGGGGRGHGGTDEDEIIAVDIAGIGAVRILGRAALDLVPGGLALGLHVQHSHGPSIGQAGPEVARRGHILAEEHVVLGNHAQRLSGDQCRRGISRGNRRHVSRSGGGLDHGRCRGLDDAGLRIDIAGLRNALIRALADVAFIPVIPDPQPFVSVLRGEGNDFKVRHQRALGDRKADGRTGRFVVDGGVIRDDEHIAKHRAGGDDFGNGAASRRLGRRELGIRAVLLQVFVIGMEIISLNEAVKLFLSRGHLFDIVGHHITRLIVHGVVFAHADIGLHEIPALIASHFAAQDLNDPVFRQAGDRVIRIVVGVRFAAEIHHPIPSDAWNDHIPVVRLSLRSGQQ